MFGYDGVPFPGRAVLEALGAGLAVPPGVAVTHAALRTSAADADGTVWITGRAGRDGDADDAAALLDALAPLAARHGARCARSGGAGRRCWTLPAARRRRGHRLRPVLRDAPPVAARPAHAPDGGTRPPTRWSRSCSRRAAGCSAPTRSTAPARARGLPALDVLTTKWSGTRRPAAELRRAQRRGRRGGDQHPPLPGDGPACSGWPSRHLAPGARRRRGPARPPGRRRRADRRRRAVRPRPHEGDRRRRAHEAAVRQARGARGRRRGPGRAARAGRARGRRGHRGPRHPVHRRRPAHRRPDAARRRRTDRAPRRRDRLRRGPRPRRLVRGDHRARAAAAAVRAREPAGVPRPPRHPARTLALPDDPEPMPPGPTGEP